MNKSGFVLIAALLWAACSVKEQKINTLSSREIAEGWQLLFNGTDMSGWKLYNGGDTTGWRVEEGVMMNTGVGSDHGGDIITKEQFASFELCLEWKIDSTSNSGVFYHVQEGAADAIYESGIEYQLIDDKGWPEPLEPDQHSGANYAMHAPVSIPVKPLDEWNSTRIVVRDSLVEHWLNGEKVVEYVLWNEDWQARKAEGKWKDVATYGIAGRGHIGLQDHGGLTLFRNIKIRKL